LAELQAAQTPVNPWFYVSIEIAFFLFFVGLIIIYVPKNKHKPEEKPVSENISITKPVPITADKKPESISKPEQNAAPESIAATLVRPPRLNLPKNIAEILSKKQPGNMPSQTTTEPKKTNNSDENPYNPIIAKIFSDAGYVVKPNPSISGFKPNLFAIGNNEIVWIGGVDCTTQDIQKAVQKLNDVFEETLSDIPINIRPFIIDDFNKLTSDDILIFHSIDELKTFVSENPADIIQEEEQDNFNSYSEYIDTIIQYIKNL
jgi:hypothetical protein